jgi:hypothetical protein
LFYIFWYGTLFCGRNERKGLVVIFDTAHTSPHTLGDQIRRLMSVSDLPGDLSKERGMAAEILSSLICSWRYLVCRLTKKGKRELKTFLVGLVEEYPLRSDSEEEFRTIHMHVQMLIEALGV